MPKAKPIVAKVDPFVLKHAEEAKEIVFSAKRQIMFQHFDKGVRGAIIVYPTPDGGAELKCQVHPVTSKIAKFIKVPCADRDDFETAFSEAREKTLAKMAEMAESQKKFKIR